jgi:hypothetical protein
MQLTERDIEVREQIMENLGLPLAGKLDTYNLISNEDSNPCEKIHLYYLPIQ